MEGVNGHKETCYPWRMGPSLAYGCDSGSIIEGSLSTPQPRTVSAKREHVQNDRHRVVGG